MPFRLDPSPQAVTAARIPCSDHTQAFQRNNHHIFPLQAQRKSPFGFRLARNGHWSRAIYVLALGAVGSLPGSLYHFEFDMIASLGRVTRRLFHLKPWKRWACHWKPQEACLSNEVPECKPHSSSTRDYAFPPTNGRRDGGPYVCGPCCFMSPDITQQYASCRRQRVSR